MICGRCGRPRAEHFSGKAYCPLSRTVKPGAVFVAEQDRLPVAGAVREIENATPAFDAPFSLDGGSDATVRERARSLFEVL